MHGHYQGTRGSRAPSAQVLMNSPFSRVFEVKWAAATDSQMALIVCLMVNFVAEHQDCLFVAKWSLAVLQLTLLGLEPFAFEQPKIKSVVEIELIVRNRP